MRGGSSVCRISSVCSVGLALVKQWFLRQNTVYVHVAFTSGSQVYWGVSFMTFLMIWVIASAIFHCVCILFLRASLPSYRISNTISKRWDIMLILKADQTKKGWVAKTLHCVIQKGEKGQWNNLIKMRPSVQSICRSSWKQGKGSMLYDHLPLLRSTACAPETIAGKYYSNCRRYRQWNWLEIDLESDKMVHQVKCNKNKQTAYIVNKIRFKNFGRF